MTTILIILMSGIVVVAEDDQTYGTMNSMCPDCVDCIDAMDAMENLPFTQFDAMSADVSSMEVTTTSGIMVEEEWAYGRTNYASTGVEHAYWDFEEGRNLGTFKNEHPDVAVFEDVSVTGCFGNNEPSYVRRGATMGPNCRCKMYIYPNLTTFSNGTELPYIHIVNGMAAFSPRCVPLPDMCYWPGCRAFIGFKDDTNFVSFLVSTNWNLYVRMYDKRGNYLGGRTIYYTTDRVGDGPSNFTRFTAHLDKDIGYMTFSGPFNGWHIDDLIVGGEPGYLGLRRDYGWAAERMKTLIGAKYHDLGLGYLLYSGTFLTADEIKDDIPDPYWHPVDKQMLFGEGICPEAAIIWAFNEDKTLINNLYMNDQYHKDFTEDIAYEDVQPGDVYFIDFPPADGVIDEVGMFIEPHIDPETQMEENIIRILPGEGVCYDSSGWIETLYGNDPEAIVDYKSLPDKPKGGKSPYPKVRGKPI